MVRSFTCVSFDHDPGFKVNGFFDTWNIQVEHHILESVMLLGNLNARCGNLQVMEDKTLVTMVIRWNDHQALSQIIDGARIFLTQMLMNQVARPLHSSPIHSPVIKKIECSEAGFNVR